MMMESRNSSTLLCGGLKNLNKRNHLYTYRLTLKVPLRLLHFFKKMLSASGSVVALCLLCALYVPNPASEQAFQVQAAARLASFYGIWITFSNCGLVPPLEAYDLLHCRFPQ